MSLRLIVGGMTITKEGTLPAPNKPIKYEARCGHCGTVFEFVWEETIRRRRKALGWWKVCPLPGCHTDVWVNA